MPVFWLALCALVGSVPKVADLRRQQPDVLQRQHVQQRAGLPVRHLPDASACLRSAEPNLLLGKHLQLQSYLPIWHMPNTASRVRFPEPNLLRWKRLQFQSHMPVGHLPRSPAALRRTWAGVLLWQHLQLNRLFLPQRNTHVPGVRLERGALLPWEHLRLEFSMHIRILQFSTVLPRAGKLHVRIQPLALRRQYLLRPHFPDLLPSLPAGSHHRKLHVHGAGSAPLCPLVGRMRHPCLRRKQPVMLLPWQYLQQRAWLHVRQMRPEVRHRAEQLHVRLHPDGVQRHDLL